MDELVFAQAVEEARRQLLGEALNHLQRVSVAAVACLANILADKSAAAGSRIMAARTILEYSFKGKELIEIEQRIAALEARHHEDN